MISGLVTAAWIDEWLDNDQRKRRVQELFRAAAKRGYRVPDIAYCGRLAWRITYIRETKDQEAEDRKLVQHGRTFLKAFAAVRSRWPKENPEWTRLANEIEDLLSFFDHEEIYIIARWAQDAWAEANNGKYPRSSEPDAPLCKFVAAVLAEAGIDLSSSAVSAVLQGKRRQHEK